MARGAKPKPKPGFLRRNAAGIAGGTLGAAGIAAAITVPIATAVTATSITEDVLDFLKDPTTLAILAGVVALFVFKK